MSAREEIDKRLYDAVERNEVETVTRLIERGADVDTRDWFGNRTVLMQACLNGNKEMVELLLRSGSDVNKTDKGGWTALHHAANDNLSKVVPILLENGCDMNKKDNIGWTTLHYAAIDNHSNVVRILLENGCDINIEDNSGQTALQLAVRQNQEDAADAIKAFTAKNPSQSPLPVNCRTSLTATASNVCPSTPVTQRMRTTTPTQQPPRQVAGKGDEQLVDQLIQQIEQLKNESSEKDREIAEMRKQNSDLQTASRANNSTKYSVSCLPQSRLCHCHQMVWLDKTVKPEFHFHFSSSRHVWLEWRILTS
ncbi:poly [ADP-ribose] polymerase tankyrase-1-like isoform X2 [Corticium candelabrum]|uniref:poly [ADP-ribose] polymerase tankyrase-1-like isoform X2 n=1 Tax=Corticium candelabrum TaxID=121492 RepID=UPI002E2743EE|nr:poly [ADP-ribose] polymerase tankyrase-1-like isoform X2 [Corticium candelabrum]